MPGGTLELPVVVFEWFKYLRSTCEIITFYTDLLSILETRGALACYITKSRDYME
jgi:hypothetical protein